MEHFDLVVIGSGPAGEKGAAQAAYFGKRVAIIERATHVGGAGINTGTLPSKTLRETALYFSGLRQRGLYGIDYSLRENLTVADLMHRKEIVIQNEWRIISANLAWHNIQLINGEASLRDAHTVVVKSAEGERELSADVILIATGSSPLHPGGILFDHEYIYDSDDILHMDRIPKSMVVIGGGVIGTEYASVFTALGVEVTLVEPRGRILAFVDSEIVTSLTEHLEMIGLKFLYNDKMTRIEAHNGRVCMELQSGSTHEFDIALIASGRHSNVQGLGLEEAGVKLGDRGLVIVNEKYQTSVPNIYAAGDVIGFPALASTSMEQARVAMVHAFDLHYKEKVSSVLPLAVYSIPEISAVGLTEDECEERNIAYLVGRASFENSARGQITGATNGMIKLIFAPEDKRLLGAHIIGEQASELIHIAMHAITRKETIDVFIEAVYNYPTLSDSYKYAAYDGLGRLREWLQNRKQ
ncbi:Si-specific NAD(P)(+) transhydrogenase [Flavihumibacter profundi]|uniref:Si-specific NAD(P)(+) transhydrogenase n=1 Tax=Flavihumibacter profundi TaxID=2716883 RepID=UPI001CC4C9E8|nr:Si-specific NAD(P)(+) transhydrogenase [Flavihumibacter profundi]MBZ5859596.1 Si-specific NAD(P)(+) transhydrogenase [Flavihumibacter profundi]